MPTKIHSEFSKEALVLLLCLSLMIGPVTAFDFDTGYAPVQIIIPPAVQYILEDVSKGGSDATLILRFTALVTNAWFDAIAPYHPTAIGVYTQHSHRLTETTNRNKNIAIIYASYHVLCSFLPKRKTQWEAILTNVDLDPLLDSSDINTPEGLGIIAGKKVAQVREQDGMNQLGDRLTKTENKKYNRNPYSDYTGFVPKNSFYQLKDPSSWQPAQGSNGNGLFKTQCFVTPQMMYTTPYSYKDPKIFKAPKPKNSDVKNHQGYKDQAQQVIDFSATLNTDRKLRAEFFDNKFNSLGFSGVHAAFKNNLGLAQFVHYDFLVNMAAFDTAIAVWQQKVRYDAVRPWSAISYIWKNKNITAWGGPGAGKVNDLPANQWKSYLNLADHPEYPSGSASLCAAHTTASRKYFNSDLLEYMVLIPKGTSTIQPGFTPPFDTFIDFNTWTDFNNDCGSSRVWGGVHFPDAVTAGRVIGTQVGELAYDFVMAHVNGTYSV